MFEKALILGLYSITPVHAGSGAELSVIDLPIQRERHTGFPVIWGQSLKGVLRRVYERFDDSQDKEKTKIIFGPDTDKAHEHAGAISVGDAKVLLFPVRSLKGVFAYVTCPLVLERFVEDVEFAKSLNSSLEINLNTKCFRNELDQLSSDLKDSTPLAVVFSDYLITNNGNVVLEDISLEAEKINKDQKYTELKKLSNIILNVVSTKKDDQSKILNRLQSKLVIVSDDLFKAFVTMTTEIVARVKINAESGTVESGGLWYEEYLPSDCVLYSMIAVGKPRIPGKNDDERKENKDRILQVLETQTLDDALNKIIKELSKIDNIYIQIGGNETVGKGFVKTAILVPQQKKESKG
jgi:CRISPR-associated protein Cmr4